MSVTISLDATQFRAGMKRLSIYKDLGPKDVNQRALNVAGRVLRALPPHNVQAKRREVKYYMEVQVSQKIKLAKSGKRKGQFIATGSAKSQLRRKHLIVQANRKKRGLKGLFGDAMRLAANELTRVAQTSQGFLKSVLLPIIVTLNPLCRFKVPFRDTGNITRWPGSAGFGKVDIAKPGWNPTATLTTQANIAHGQQAKVQALEIPIYQKALNDEGAEMIRHAEKRLAELAKRP